MAKEQTFTVALTLRQLAMVSGAVDKVDENLEPDKSKNPIDAYVGNADDWRISASVEDYDALNQGRITLTRALEKALLLEMRLTKARADRDKRKGDRHE